MIAAQYLENSKNKSAIYFLNLQYFELEIQYTRLRNLP